MARRVVRLSSREGVERDIPKKEVGDGARPVWMSTRRRAVGSVDAGFKRVGILVERASSVFSRH